MLMPAAPGCRADIPVRTAAVADLRAREFSRLDAAGVTYLDYAGAALYPASLVRRDAKRMATAILGNPPRRAARPSPAAAPWRWRGRGAVRASLGLATQPADIDRVIACIEDITAPRASRSARGSEESRAQSV
jgi:selenocysteine lyase/cysteine desulfurase